MRKLILSLVLALGLFVTLALPAVALPSRVLWETSTAVTASSAVDIYLTNWSAQTFTTGSEAHTVSQIRLLLYREGSNDTITVSIRKVSETDNVTSYPNGNDLTSGTINSNNEITTNTNGVWYGINVTPYSLEANTQYAIVVRNESGTSGTVCADWRMDDSSSSYAGGSEWLSTNSGITWTSDTDNDYLFELWGESLIEVTGAQVFRNYLEDDDMLFVLQYYNTYVPYYPNQDPASSFNIQLRNTTGSTILAQTTCRAWGNKPGSIYLSADTAAGLTPGAAYRIYIYGNFAGYPSDNYTLQSSDWRGSDLTFLDQWILATARDIGDYYDTDMTTFLAGDSGEEVLNTEGGIIFSTGIPGLLQVRPDLFELTSGVESYQPTSWTDAFAGATTWDVQVGTTAATALTAVGTLFGIDGKTAGAFLLLAFYLALALAVVFRGGDATIAVILAIPFVLLGAWLRLIDITIIAVVAAVGVLILVYRFWFART